MARRQGRGLRIIAGEHRGSRLETPKGKLLRPMRDQVRGALFNILTANLPEARVLDLFAGSGSLGLEALSRGAAHTVFVDRAPPCLACLKKNVAHLRLEERSTVLQYDLVQGAGGLARHGPFDLILVHPPFVLLKPSPNPPELDVAALLQSLTSLLAPEGRIAFETPVECYTQAADLPALDVILRRTYGSTAVFIAGPVEPEPNANGRHPEG